MHTYPNIAANDNNSRPQVRIGAYEDAQVVDTLEWKEVQNAFKSLSNVWDPAKDLAQTVLQRRARSALGPVRFRGLQEVSNVERYSLGINPERLSIARPWWRPISRSVSLIHPNHYSSSHPVLTTHTVRLYPGVTVPDARSLTGLSHL